ncbi:hypothetical protein [Chitinophaga nivalis]|uniref:Exostosin GT47 domain-containing protein n=1 Tax=Chitinophaga nivalis TaxID=2991709 RepID=A0ABT3IH70_9BACT|nr:hypothetical protein [Chitinophaga nivalis]MCW3466989.1 hypothetical protein [Chitinophaga nivalis]MCW3483320.1 hypothetical protein [Chitinophaga nivalis]
MGWSFDTLSNISHYENKICVIDNRIIESECLLLHQYLRENAHRKFMFVIIDPYREACVNHYYYELMENVYHLPNVLYLTKYNATEWALDLDPAQRKTTWIPYPYDISREINTDSLNNRKSKIIFSGALLHGIYPLRSAFLKKNIHAGNEHLIDWLKHPGHEDDGDIMQHDVIKESYLTFLSQYKFMFLCPSRCQLEFLKFRECAYAGCVPVGQLPTSMLSAVNIFKWDDSVSSAQLTKLLATDSSQLLPIVQQYRRFFREERTPAKLNKQLAEFLKVQEWI